MAPPKKTSQNNNTKTDKPNLTAKQSLFVKEYLIDLNATQAAIRVGYSPKTAQEQSSRLLSNVIIKDAIQNAMEERSKEVSITARDVLESIIMIRGMAVKAEKLNDALKANELLGKHLKLFIDKTELTGADGAPLDLTVNFVKPQ